MKYFSAILAIFVLAALLGSETIKYQAAQPVPNSIPNFRGMTVSCPMEGRIWTTPLMDEAIQEIKEHGISMIAVHPYAFLTKSGELSFDPDRIQFYIESSYKKAKKQGLELFLKPHIGYWGVFSWRGEIDFKDDRLAWERFYASYERFILYSATVAEKLKIPLFAMGVETDHLTHKPFWRELITKVREVYSGALTFAANWDTYLRVPFWGELDYIGIQAYFPLADNKDKELTVNSLKESWSKRFAELNRFADRFGRKILFTEIGYSRGDLAAIEPWKPQYSEKNVDIERRKKLICAAMHFLNRNPLVIGYFWWKWMPGNIQRDDFDFSMRDKEALQIMKSFAKTGSCEI